MDRTVGPAARQKDRLRLTSRYLLMTHKQTLLYWQNMRIAMEAAGDTSSAIYKRALAISQGLPDPLAIPEAAQS